MTLDYDPRKICQHLRSKEMLTREAEGHRPVQDERLLDAYDAVAYWCEKTHTGRGPDEEPVHLDQCCTGTTRTCFLGIDGLA